MQKMLKIKITIYNQRYTNDDEKLPETLRYFIIWSYGIACVCSLTKISLFCILKRLHEGVIIWTFNNYNFQLCIISDSHFSSPQNSLPLYDIPLCKI